MSDSAVWSIASELTMTDALTPNHDGTPEFYTVDVDNLEYLVSVVLELAIGRESQVAVELASAEMAAVITDGDAAEAAAPVSGEAGRSAVVAKRDALYEDPAGWLANYAKTLAHG